LLDATNSAGGIWRPEDLSHYTVVERAPVSFMFLGRIHVTSASLPSAGGMALAETLQILERTAFRDAQPAQRVHFVVEALRRAYQDRARYLGDSDFVQVPVDRLVSEAYATRRARSIDPTRASSSALLDEAAAAAREGDNTTHFSIIDRDGNRVAATLSINTPFGSGIVAGTTGVILNNEMDDFATSPGVPNAYGLTGARANGIEPRKRPLSSMSPTFVEDERGVLILGTPGGARIISMVALGILDYALQPVPDPVRIVGAPRYHHQYRPDRIEIEAGSFAQDTLGELEAMGYEVKTGVRKWGNMQAVYVDKRTGRATAASDPRGVGAMPWPGQDAATR
jgi:gamma-glutamyltranspeptidase/glutathione hydrolase